MFLLIFKRKYYLKTDNKNVRLKTTFYSIAYLITLFTNSYSAVPISAFLTSTKDHYSSLNKIINSDFIKKKLSSSTPLLKEFNNPTVHTPPHIFLILIESLNAEMINKNNTPYLEDLKNNSIFFENFYGNSIQTTKGHFATFCSLIPSFKGKVSKDYSTNNFNCLPKILDKNNYQTIFTQASHYPKFDNARKFFKHLGFDSFKYTTRWQKLIAKKNKQFWGWGIEDSLFYENVFHDLDKVKDKNDPLFVAMATINNHVSFCKTPKKRRRVKQRKHNRKDCYTNSINIVDQGVKKFFDLLSDSPFAKNSIVLITGDHSFPLNGHGGSDNEVGFAEENFKTGLYIVDTRNEKNFISSELASQLDIAPTILTYAGISTSTHFLGKNIFKNKSQFIPMVQPYDGRYLVLRHGDYKYAYHHQTQSEFVFNIKNKLIRNNNIIKSFPKDELTKFRSKFNDFFIVQKLLENNRIWNK